MGSRVKALSGMRMERVRPVLSFSVLLGMTSGVFWDGQSVGSRVFGVVGNEIRCYWD